ncbi:MAG: hypothetical protein E7360_01335 [Clostridiales bacterium]|nr:hypothetical protein [Clostridiales bacterium]
MKIAYLILVHRDPLQIKRLTNRLLKTGDCFIHLDKKSDCKSFLNQFGKEERVDIISKYRVSWAGWTMVQAYLELLEKALKSEKKYDRFVFMTGQDYPLMTDGQICNEFQANLITEYVMAYKISTSTIATDKNKILKRWYFDVPFKNRFLRRVYLSVMYRFITKPFTKKELLVKLDGKKVEPYFGQMLSAYTREGASLILNTYHNDKVFNRQMKRVHAAVEIYWQTIIFNSKLRKNTIQHGEEHEITEHFGWAPLHYHSYDEDTAIYTEKDFEELKNSGYMFCRKVIPGISDTLMDKIDEMRKE